DGAPAETSREWCAAPFSEASVVLLVAVGCWDPDDNPLVPLGLTPDPGDGDRLLGCRSTARVKSARTPACDSSQRRCRPQMKYMRMARISRPRTMATVSEVDQGKTPRDPVVVCDDSREMARW